MLDEIEQSDITSDAEGSHLSGEANRPGLGALAAVATTLNQTENLDQALEIILVEIGASGVTLRDLAVDLHAKVLIVVGPQLGTLNYTALTLEALAAKNVSSAGLVIGAWPEVPGVAERDNRDALEGLDRVRAVLPAGAGTLTEADFAAMSASAFDPRWLASLAD